MPPAITALQTLQWGKETTRGTAVAATSKIAVEGIQFAADDEMARPRLAKGLLTSVPGDETVTRRGTTFSIPETPLVYDQHQHFLLGCVKGGVTSSPGTGAPETWTFLRSLTADPAPEARTLERRLSDGTNFIDNEWSYALFSQLRWIYAIDQPLRFAAEGFARRIQSSTLTAGQAMPTIAIPASPLAKIWIDATWAALGTTQITAQVLSADITFRSGLMPKWTLDGRTDLDWTTHILNPEAIGIDATIRMLIKADSGQFATEKTAAAAGTLRAVRLEILGASSNEFELDMLLKHQVPEIQTIGSEDGQDIVEMKLVNSTDGTEMFSAKLVNQVSTTT